MSDSKGLDDLPVQHIAQSILLARGQKVLLDADLAGLYGVPTKQLNQQVRRNLGRFPADFMFQLTDEELANLRSQIVTSSSPPWGGRRYPPYAFTEHGAIMAASVLNSARAVKVSVYIVRAFVRLRQIMASDEELARKVQRLERKSESHEQAIAGILNQLHEQMNPVRTRAIGFTADFKRKP